MGTMSTRIDQELVDAAKVVGARHSRSAAQQLDHWARIGREFETAPATTRRAIDDVLSGRASYDSLPDTAQATVRATWAESIRDDVAALDLRDELTPLGEPWPEADATGSLVMRQPNRAGRKTHG
jgi:hypothetical protein